MTSLNGISVALQALLTQSASLDIINHNVANANTSGYHRQEAVLMAGPTQGTPGFVNSTVISQIGTGVVLTDIKRYNDNFADIRYRAEVASSSRWATTTNVLSQVESLEDETSEDGMSTKLDEFWTSWKDVSDDPQDTALRSALLESASQLCDAFHTRYAGLMQIQADLDNTVIQDVQEINTLATQVAQLNAEISRYATSSTQKNDFLDQQEIYLDRLSELAGAKITFEPNGMAMVSIGGHMLVQGTQTIQLTTVTNTSNSNLKDIMWVDGQEFNPTNGELYGVMDVRDNIIEEEKTSLNNLAATIFNAVNSVHRQGYGLNDVTPAATGGSAMIGGSIITSGSIIEGGSIVGGSIVGGSVVGSYPEYTYASGSANPVGRDFFVVDGDTGYESGWDENGNPTGSTNIYPSMINLALSISINPDIESDVNNIAAAMNPDASGDNSLAEDIYAMAGDSVTLKQVNTGYPGNGGSALIDLLNSEGTAISENINDYNSQRVTELSLTIQRAETMQSQHESLLTALTTDRESVSGVSLDEEAAELIKYQRSYQAAIRMMTAVDDMLDRVINGMGKVGL